jgi:signal peptidase I
MAPTLLGWHRELICPNCQYPFDVGIDEEGHTGPSVCPNCGATDLDRVPAVECGGDRVLVQKFLYDFRRPKRWEVAVFHYPGDPSQAYVKRVVGLPGESVRIEGGDVYADGRIVRKSLHDQRAMRILVHDSRFEPRDGDRYPRWWFRSGWGYGSRATGWKRTDRGFVHEAKPKVGPGDWVIYRHWDPIRQRFGPVRDFYAYNGGELPADNEVLDLGLEARLTVDRTVEAVSAGLRSGADQFLVRIPVGLGGNVELVRNGVKVPINGIRNPMRAGRTWPRTVTLEASVFDRRVTVAIDGELLFEPYDYENPRPRLGPTFGEIPIGVGVFGDAMTIHELQIFRDVHYTPTLAGMPRQGNAIRSAVALGPDEYFVLGDNSPVSNDSRFWDVGAVVPGSMLLGKPFLVHLPGAVVPLQVFGRSVCWVPDPRRIRYIR